MASCRYDQCDCAALIHSCCLDRSSIACEAVLERITPVIRRTAQSRWTIFRRYVHADDIVQDVLLKISGKLCGWDNRGPLCGWVAIITYRYVIDFQRKNKRIPAQHDPKIEVVDPSTTKYRRAIEDWSDDARECLKAIRIGLAPEDRRIFDLRFENNKTQEEIAKIMRCSERTIRNRLHQIKKDARSCLESRQS